MRRVIPHVVVTVAVAVSGGACGNAYSGEESPNPPAASSEAGSDASADSGVVLEATCDAIDFRRALIIVGDTESCPEGTTERMLVTGGQALEGACSCGTCTPVKAASCAGAGIVTNNFGPGDQCSGGSTAIASVTDGACIASPGGPFDLSAFNRWTARTPAAGTCTAAAIADATKVKATGLRACTPIGQPAVCAAIDARRRLCTESLGGGCGGDFALAVDAGDAATATCGACGCTLTSPSCKVEYHGNASCTLLKYTATLDGVCTRTNDENGISHLKFMPAQSVCAATPGAATVSIANKKTYCCTP